MRFSKDLYSINLSNVENLTGKEILNNSEQESKMQIPAKNNKFLLRFYRVIWF